MNKKPRNYESINYSLRPGKAIERKMLVEALQRLSAFAPLRSYRYVGMGSTFFNDFILIHRSLGINDMISIERDIDRRSRFEFNKPFSCITMEFSDTTAFLARTSWEKKTILWLDYTDKLADYMLADIKYFVAGAVSGSCLIVSVNAHPDDMDDDRMELLKRRVGEDNIPRDITDKDLTHKFLPKTYHRIINNIIQETLSDRNGPLDSNRLTYRQIFNFIYADGATMLTVGGVFFEEQDELAFNKASFNDLPFASFDSEHHRVEVPSLTFKEMRHLDAQFPVDDVSQIQANDISLVDLEKYLKIYRYFPVFAETNL